MRQSGMAVRAGGQGVSRWARAMLSGRARCLWGIAFCVFAVSAQGGQALGTLDATQRTAQQWLVRMQEASRSRNYTGTVVELHASGAMAVSRVWHAVRDGQQFERIDALDGAASTVYRYDGVVRTFMHQSRTVRTERRDLLQAPPGPPGDLFVPPYTAHLLGQERVAGMDADVVWFEPRDALRFGYRFWSERASGLVLRVQTLAPGGRVLEQTAFSAVQLDAGAEAERGARKGFDLAGYQDRSVRMRATTASEQGWGLREPVDGFVPVGCYLHVPVSSGPGDERLQCFFSDGLVTVSLFIERQASRHNAVAVVQRARGAAHVLIKQLNDGFWLTAVGEVPPATLALFADRLVRLQ